MVIDHRCKLTTLMLAVLALLLLSVSMADARVGGAASGRGLRSLLPGPAVRTPLRPSRSLDRSPRSAQPGNRPGATTTAKVIKRPGLVGGFVAGFLGAGVLGALFGQGFLAGIGGPASLIGLLLQIAMLAFVGWLAWGWWQRRASPAFAGLSPRQLADAYDRPRGEQPERWTVRNGIEVEQSDYDAFERLLSEVQTSYGREDLSALRARVTPEMFDQLGKKLARNASRGLVHRVSDIKLLQGHLVEAWREPDCDHATVSMRFSLVERMIERTTDREVEGGPDEVAEMWTFVRSHGGGWRLSEIEPA